MFAAALFVCAFTMASRASAAQPDTTDSVGGESTLIEDGPQAASDGEHLWYTQALGTRGEYRILHHGPGMDPTVVGQALVVGRRPEALLASDGALYLIFPPTEVAATSGESASYRTVQTIQSVFDLNERRWVFSPPGRGRVLPTLPGSGSLGGVAVADGRPMALILPSESVSGSEEEAPIATLVVYRNGEWQDVEFPEIDDAGAAHSWRLLDGATPILIAVGRSPEQAAVKAFEWRDGEWREFDWTLDPTTIVSTSPARSRTAVLGDLGAGKARLHLLWSDALWTIGELRIRAEESVLLEYGEQVAIFHRRGESAEPYLTAISIETGTVFEERQLGEMPTIRREDFGSLVFIGGLLLAALVMFLFRPDPTKMRVTLPPGTRLAEPMRRLAAMVIDLAPCALLVRTIMEAPLAELVRSPLVTRDPSDAAPALLMIAICVVYTTIAELIWSRTLGKWFMECYVVSVDGTKPKAVQILVRNAMRGIALVVPPLVLFVLMNPYRQRLGDMAARTVVVNDPEPNEESPEAESTADQPDE